MRLIYEQGAEGRRGVTIPKSDVPAQEVLPNKYLRDKEPMLPEVSELEVVRHFTNLSRLNFSVDSNGYPLGSCTMKYNPKFTEQIASMEGFIDLHPLLPALKGEKH